MKFTTEQQQAIDLFGDSLLVSAAAGSGKTAVLTERVVQKLCADPPVDASRLMILTFTEAAANEMRGRISKKLRKQLKTHPSPELIKRQISMLPQTQISTIHAACLSLIRKNFEQLGIDPRFSIADENHLALMKKEMLDDFIESIYEEAEQNEDIRRVIDAMFESKSDKELVSALDKGSEFLDKLPYPRLFIDNIDKRQVVAAATEIAREQLLAISDTYERIATGGHGGVSEWFDVERESLAPVINALKNDDFDGAVTAARCVKFENFLRPKDIPKEKWPFYQKLRKALKGAFLKLCEDYLFTLADQMNSDREDELPILKSYLELCDRFNGLLQKKRLSERILSYNDLERFTLKLLIESYDGKTLVKTETAKELSEYYQEIIVDEYQDCNLVQELIFCALSRDEKNIFAVGDVKQSIYRFRGAEPSLFLGRQKRSQYHTGTARELLQKTKIDLFCNFRSHKKVLDFINGIFYLLMANGRDIDYKDGHELYASDRYANSCQASVDMLLYVSSDKSKLKASRVRAEAVGIAAKIKQMIGNTLIYDPELEAERTVRASDIAVIMRAPKTNGLIFERELERAGVGCINNNPSEKYLETQEVREALAFLQTINNPYDDIPLITVMYSQYFGYTTDELGRIRAGAKRVLFYDAVREYAKTDKKTAEFLRILSELRALSLCSSLHGLITAMYEKTAVLTRILSQKNGALKRENLLMLADIASSFEAGGYKSLFSFITYLIKLSENDDETPVCRLRNRPDCVTLMSIHKSKGLEFPVVFFVNTTATIQPVKNKRVLLSPPSDAGGMIIDNKTHRRFNSLAYNIVYHNEQTDGFNEYMRLLYVALTRAGSRLYISGSLKVDKALELIEDCNMIGGAPTSFDIENDPSFFKWALMPYICTDGANRLRAFAGLETAQAHSEISTDVIDIDTLDIETEEDDCVQKVEYSLDEDEIVRLISRKTETYDIPAKLSVSELKNIGKSDSAAQFKKPRFLQGGVTGADRGSATHKFLQFCDFLKVCTKEGFEQEKQRLVSYEFITKADADLVDGEGIIRFVNTDRMRSLITNYNMRKEERFMFSLPASEILDTDSNELVTLQGVLDCLFENGTEAVIVDYKTDRVSDERELVQRYGIQLDMYARAIKINEGLETTEKLIYSFALEKFINV